MSKWQQLRERLKWYKPFLRRPDLLWMLWRESREEGKGLHEWYMGILTDHLDRRRHFKDVWGERSP